MNEWLAFSLILLGVWLALFVTKPAVRREMFWVSLFTMPFGLTEPMFVPEYWSPPSMFDLAANTGFDMESLIFCFAVGGIGSVSYEYVFRAKHRKMDPGEMHDRRHRFHKLAILSPGMVLAPLYFLTDLNPIYSVSIAMFVGGIAAILCRPDLNKKVWVGGALFLAIYFFFFLFFNLAYPGLVREVWNLPAISGILILGIPAEELMFAFTFGMMWSSIYEHVLWYGLEPMQSGTEAA